MSYETSQAAFSLLLTQSDAIVRQANVRHSLLLQATSTNQRAWEAAKKAAMDADPELSEGDAEEIANEKFPPITPEQDEAIRNGDSDGSDVAGNEPDPAMPEVDEGLEGTLGIPGLGDYIKEIGGVFIDTSKDSMGQFNPETHRLVKPDLADDSLVLAIPFTTPIDQELHITKIIGDSRKKEEEEEPQAPWSVRHPSLEMTDPFIRTPEDYRFGGDGITTALSKTYGGTLLSGQNYAASQDVFDQAEIDFINRTQGAGSEGEWVETGWDEMGRPTGYRMADRPQANIIDLPGAIAPEYRESDVLDMISGMSTVQIIEFQTLAGDAGFYGTSMRADVPGYMSSLDESVLATIMGQSNVSGETVWPMLELFADAGRATRAASGSGVVKEPFSVPAHLRSIPGEKTVAEEVKLRFRQKMGREARPDELGGIASELSGYYTKSNQEEIALYLAAYNGDNQGLLTGAQMQRIEDPGAATSFDIGEKWTNEIDLNARRESNGESFKRMLSATMGNRPSVGNMTAAGGVQTIGRT